MLRNKADRKTLVFMLVIMTLLAVQWNLADFHPLLIVAGMFMAVTVAVMAHNHNHLPIWKSNFLNVLTDYWITLFYGYPACAWIPTHNMNHHVHNNRPEDYTITYRASESNNIVTLLSYPSISGGIQQKANFEFLKQTLKKDKKKGIYYISQYVVLIAYIVGALILDWKKALFFIIIPQQFSLFAVLIFNYIQHVHADELSKWNHSRNFVGWGMNAFLFNNGYHTVHHMNPRKHWSEAKASHQEVAHHIDPMLSEQSFWGYMIRVYILGMISPRFKTFNMRLARIEAEKNRASQNQSGISELKLAGEGV